MDGFSSGSARFYPPFHSMVGVWRCGWHGDARVGYGMVWYGGFQGGDKGGLGDRIRGRDASISICISPSASWVNFPGKIKEKD